MAKRRTLERVGSFNVAGRGRDRRKVLADVREFIADENLDALVLQEVMFQAAFIRLRMLLRWRVWSAPAEWPEAQNLIMMCRRSVPSRNRRRDGGRGWVRMRIGWRGPKHGLEHPGRTWPWWIIDGVALLDVHRVWGGPAHPRNGAAYAEEAAALIEWGREHRDLPYAMLGDFNTSPRDKRAGTPADVAGELGARVVYDRGEPGVDYALTRGLQGTVKRGRKYGSDHRATVLHITGRRDTLRDSLGR